MVKEIIMSREYKCKTCCDGEYYSYYGLAPHKHNLNKTGSIIGSTEIEPDDKWPDNFSEDPDAPGCGVYSCPECHGKYQ